MSDGEYATVLDYIKHDGGDKSWLVCLGLPWKRSQHNREGYKGIGELEEELRVNWYTTLEYSGGEIYSRRLEDGLPLKLYLPYVRVTVSIIVISPFKYSSKCTVIFAFGTPAWAICIPSNSTLASGFGGSKGDCEQATVMLPLEI